MAGSTSKITLDDTLRVFKDLPQPGTPLTASEVADELGCVRRTAYGKLTELEEQGKLRTKKVGARGRVWWRIGPESTVAQRSESGPLSQAQLDEFVDAVADYAIFVLDTDGHVQTWNDGAERIKGYAEEEIIGQHFSSFYTDEARAENLPQRNLEKAAEEGRVEDEGFRVRKNGSTFWANVVITALYDHDGTLRGFVKVTRDMTQRHAYEERLQQEKERFETLVREVKDYAIFLLDPDGHVRTWNQGAREIKGYTEEEIVGNHFSRFYTEEDREARVPQRNLEKAAEEGRVEDEGTRVRKDGSTFWANVVITALYDEGGDLRGFAKVTRDMTERHEYEEQLRQQRDELTELNRINSVIRDIDQALVTAGTREEIGQAVCDRLAMSDTYAAAWIGEYTEGYEEVIPRTWAGLNNSSMDAINTAESASEQPLEQDLGATALRTRTVQTGSQIREDGQEESWQERTLAAGFELAVIIPLVYNDVEYGVLTVYAETESAFDNRKIAVLSELGETISHSIAAVRSRERERTLTSLQAATRDLLYTESNEEIGDIIVAAITDELAIEDAVVYLFDTSENTLEPVSASFPLRPVDGGLELLDAGDDSQIWSSFVDAEPRRIEAPATEAFPSTGFGDRQALAIPLGNHGVLVVTPAQGEVLDEQTRNLIGLIGTTAEAAFDRVESQANLRERDEILQERNQRLQRLNQINTIIRGVDQALIQTTTREEVLRVVCDQLTDSDRFRFAWIGRIDDAQGEIVPQVWSGKDSGYLDSVSLRDSENEREPAIRTADSGEVTVVPNVADDLRKAQWRKEAFTREFQSVISVPLSVDSVTHGVLTVYADSPEEFQELEQTVFEELGGTIAHTLDFVETRQSMLSDEWMELEFRLQDESSLFLSRLADQIGGEVLFEGFIPLSENKTRLFFFANNGDSDDISEVINRSVAVETSHLISSQDGGHLFEAVVDGSTIPLMLMDQGASLQSLTVSEDGIQVVVDLPSNADVREFIERFQREYESAEFLARRRRERPPHSRHGLRAELASQLTDRQLEVLQTAYFSGFFASPRRSTGSEIAEVLDVSQPTVTEHLRSAQAKMLDILLADHSTSA